MSFVHCPLISIKAKETIVSQHRSQSINGHIQISIFHFSFSQWTEQSQDRPRKRRVFCLPPLINPIVVFASTSTNTSTSTSTSTSSSAATATATATGYNTTATEGSIAAHQKKCSKQGGTFFAHFFPWMSDHCNTLLTIFSHSLFVCYRLYNSILHASRFANFAI